MLADSDSDVRQAVAQALGTIGEPASIEALVLALTDEERAVRQAAELALGRIDANWVYSEAAQRAMPQLEAVAERSSAAGSAPRPRRSSPKLHAPAQTRQSFRLRKAVSSGGTRPARGIQTVAAALSLRQTDSACLLPECPDGRLRLEQAEFSRLAWAFALSLAFHLLVFGGYQTGKKYHLWQHLHWPAWLQPPKIPH